MAQDFSFTNWKDKYQIQFGTFNGNFRVTVLSMEKDKTKYVEVPLDYRGYSDLIKIVNRIEKDPADKSEMILVGDYDKDTKQYQYKTVIGFKKNSNMTYSVFVSASTGGENRTYQAGLFGNKKVQINSEVQDERESSANELDTFKRFLESQVPIDIAVGSRDLKQYYQQKTTENIAIKVGAEVSKPKYQQGGFGNKGGGGGGYKPNNSYTPPAAAPPSDGIPF